MDSTYTAALIGTVGAVTPFLLGVLTVLTIVWIGSRVVGKVQAEQMHEILAAATGRHRAPAEGLPKRNECDSCGQSHAIVLRSLPDLGEGFPAMTLWLCVPCAAFSDALHGVETVVYP
jgi:hypothetical protein